MKYEVGQMLTTKYEEEFEIIEILPARRYKVKFTECGTIVETSHQNLEQGSTRYPYRKTVFGVGYYGIGEYVAKVDNKHNYYYRVWQSMHDRCYSGKTSIYNNVTVCEEWQNYQNFAKWFHETFPFELKHLKMRLDKDVLQQNKDLKIYSPETCVWIPSRINSYIQSKRSDTKNELKGVTYDKGRWIAESVDFDFPQVGVVIGRYDTQEEAHQAYKEFKLQQDSKARDYLRNLNYLPEEIIQLVRTV